MVAHDVRVSIGPDQVSWDELMEVVDYAIHQRPSFQEGYESGQFGDALDNLLALDQARLGYRNELDHEDDDDNKDNGSYTMTDLLIQFRRFQSTLPVDKIFALAGLWPEFRTVESKEAAEMRYRRTESETWQHYGRIVIEKEPTLRILHLVGELDRAEDLPSWAPDLRAVNYARAARVGQRALRGDRQISRI